MSMKRSFLKALIVVLVLFLASCSKNAENEHLPEYCQTYAGFTATASRDMFELLDDAGYTVNRFNYLSVISEIELDFELDDPNRTVDLGGIQCFQNLTSLSLSGRSFKDISDISALSNIQSIQLRNTSIVSIDSFKNLSKINNLVISETKTLQNVEGVGEMTKLTTLDLSNNGLVNIGELNALVNLQHLYLDHNDIIYFPSINNLEHLETLDISYNNIIQLGDDLSGLRNLEELNASNNQICDISTLDDLERVEELDLSYNNLGCNGVGVSPNFDSLENAVNLNTLKLNNNGLTSIEGLRDRDISLEVLHLHNNDLSDITPISEYTNIVELVLYNNNISNIDNLSGMTGLTSIDLSENNISDFSDLMLITNLTHIDLSQNNISIIPDIGGEWLELSVLDLHSNPLVDVSGVEGHPSLESLILYNSGLTVLEGISNLPELDTLVIVDEEAELELDPADRNPNVISTLIDSFNNNPSLSIQEDFVLDLGFDFGPNVEIYNSIQGSISVGFIDWDNLDIDVIDETSIQLPNLAIIDLRFNNLTDIRFILGNPDLEQLYLSNNAITNISVINGTDTDDLDALTVVEIDNNFVGSSLQNAFIDLPSLEQISLAGTPLISIENSFNNLSALETFSIEGGFLQSITDSFNNLFATYLSTNVLTFVEGNIAVIENSFNGGQYNSIEITDQSPIVGATRITDSFNDLNMVGESGIAITGSEFSTITGSFLRLTTDILTLQNNEIQTITTSFTEADITTLNISVNVLSTVPSLNTATSIETLNLDENILSTLAFIDGIPDLENLSFVQQEAVLGLDTLTTLDGINNQPLLTSFTGDLSGITSITGFQNTGITDLDLSQTTMGVTSSISIGANAFTGSPIDILSLEGHDLSDLAFLANLTAIETLSIGLDVANFSDFTGLPMELTLTSLSYTNTTGVADYSALSGYDVLETLILPDDTTDIIDLDGLDALDTITLDPTSIQTITDSFNNLPSFEPNEVYLAPFTSLTDVTRSFNLYGSVNNTIDFIVISGSYNIIDSFHNVGHVSIEDNNGDLTPTFDPFSFTVMESIFFEYGSYNSYTFINGYASLSSLTIAELNSNITDLDNTVLDIVALSSTSLTLSTVSMSMAETGTLLFTSLAANDFDITINAADLSIEADNGTVTLNVLNNAISLSGGSDDFILNGTSLTSLDLDGFEAQASTYNTPLLTTITRSSTAVVNASQLDVYTSATTINYAVDATILNIYGDNLTSVTLDTEDATTTIFGDQPILTLDVNVGPIAVEYDTLTSLTVTGVMSSLTVDSTLFTSLDTGVTSIEFVIVTANQPSLEISGSAINSLSVSNDAISSITAAISGVDMILTSSSTTLSLDDTTNIGTLDLSNMNSLDSLDFGAATISSIELSSTSSSMTISGSTGPSIVYSTTTLDTLTLDSPLANLTISDSATTLLVDGVIGTLTLEGDTIDSITINPLSSIDSLVISGETSLSSLTTNDSTITTLNITTNATSFTLDGTNVSDTNIDGISLNSVIFDVGVNDIILTIGTDSLTLTGTANTVTLSSNTDSLTIDNSSSIVDLSVSSTNLLTVASGTADIATVDILDSGTALIVTGSNIDELLISGSATSIIATLDASTELTVNSPDGTTVDVTTNATTLFFPSNDGGTYDITSSAPSLTIEVQTSDISIDNASLSSIDVTALVSIITIESSQATMTLVGEANMIDITNTNLTSIDLTGVSLGELLIESNALSVIDILDVVTNAVTLKTNQPTLSVSGITKTIFITNNTFTTLNLVGTTFEQVFINADSLVSLDAVAVDSLNVNTGQATFQLTTDAEDVSFTSDVASDLTVISELVGMMILETNSKSVTLNAVNTSFTIDGTNLDTISGVVDSIETGGFTGLALTLDVSGNQVTITDPGSLVSITYNNGNTLNTLSIESTDLVTSINTNDATIGLIELYVNSTVQITLSTSSDDVQIEAEALGGFTDVQLSYQGTTPLSIDYTGLSLAGIDLNSEDALIASGEVGQLTIVGANLSSFTTTNLSVSGTLTMNNTSLSTLDFASATLLTSLSTLEMNTLSNANMEDIITTLDGSTLTLISPILSSDVYNYFYTSELADLVAQEAIDSAYYDSIRSAAIDDSWAEVLANEYMDHLDETTTKSAIDANTLGDEDFYFNSYLTDAGITVGDLAVGEETTIRNAITATLNSITGLMDEPTLQADTTTTIEADADTTAQNATDTTTFTIG